MLARTCCDERPVALSPWLECVLDEEDEEPSPELLDELDGSLVEDPAPWLELPLEPVLPDP